MQIENFLPKLLSQILWDEVFPGSCRTCMTIVSRVQKQIGSDKSEVMTVIYGEQYCCNNLSEFLVIFQKFHIKNLTVLPIKYQHIKLLLD